MRVIDASAVIELLLWTPSGKRVARAIAAPRETLHAPHLLDVEVAQVLRRTEQAGVIASVRAQQALDALADLELDRHEHTAFLPRVWELRRNITAYDAAYVALAEVLNAPLLTFDKRLAGSPGHRASIVTP